MFSNSNKPKFSLDFTINDLSNIPHVGGSCYIDVSIRDSKKSKFSLRPSHAQAGAQATFDSSKNSIQSKLDSKSSSSHSSSTPSTVTAVTSKKKIHNFKCSFHFSLSCNLRFPLKKKENLIGNKYLILTIYYLPDSSHHHGEDSHSASELGQLDINLSEYLNFKEATTFKYLLKHSKVNSIISLTVSLKELPSDFQFHTQLQISEAHTNLSNANTKVSTSRPTQAQTTNRTTSSTLQLDSSPSSQNPKFNVPNFEKKKVFGGINDVINTSSGEHQNSGNESELDLSNINGKTEENGKECSISKKISQHLSPHHSNSKLDGSNANSKANSISGNSERANNNSSYGHSALKNASGNDQQTAVMMEPIVSNLYKKILESSWDPELYKLLDYTPEKIVDSIFREGTGWSDKISKKLEIWNAGNTDDDDEVRDLNGLINEVGFREDLKSWHTSAH
ncbi:hypothetical protein CLIB1423_02S02696 [[Candida] railenensis]|uniref:C2 NT-type domain-containing protein n=1 Tax=[Candida] railenensis TaxID=45579 RepID=A0A9P0QLC9_9ASCO|nr:hypothetical protein CLIB1423_02S02696 [[Candida] railenensis]